MPSFIPDDFEPDDNSYKNLAKHGAIREFVDDQFDYFMTYWLEKKTKGVESGKKESWQMTLQTWMRRAWNGRAGRKWEKERHYTTRAPSNAKPISDLLGGIPTPREGATVCGRALPREEKRKCTGKDASCPDSSRSTIRSQPLDYPTSKPAPAPMTPEQAFDQLRKDGVL